MTDGDKIDGLAEEFACSPLEAKKALEKRDFNMVFAREYLERYKLDDPKIVSDNARFQVCAEAILGGRADYGF